MNKMPAIEEIIMENSTQNTIRITKPAPIRSGRATLAERLCCTGFDIKKHGITLHVDGLPASGRNKAHMVAMFRGEIK